MSVKGAGRSNGYSLAEVLVVVTLIGMGSMVVLPNLQNMIHASRLRAASLQVLSALRLARSAAMASQDPHIVSFDSGKAITIRNQIDSLAEPGYEHSPLPPIASLVVEGGGPPRIIFQPDGSSKGGTVTLTSRPLHGEGPRRIRIEVYRSGLSRVLPGDP